MTLREIVHAHVPTLSLQSTVRDAIDKMDVYQFPALVILNDDQVPVADITEGDVCRTVFANESLTSIAKQKAMTFATSDPITEMADTEIANAFHKMLSSGLTVLPVLDGSTFCGVVLRVDLMQAMLLDCVP